MTLPAGYRERLATPADAAAVRLLLNAEGMTSIGSALVGEEWPLRDWSGPSAAPEDFVVVEGPAGEVCAYGGVEATAPYREVYAIVTVAPAHHGRGLGAWLLRDNEARGRRLATLAPAGEPVVVNTAAMADEPRASALLAAHGYREVRRFLRMVATFAEPPQPPRVPPGVTLRTFHPGQDERALYDCHLAAFADAWGDEGVSFDEWRHSTYDAADFEAPLWLLAWADGTVAGYAGCRERSGTDAALGHVRVLGVDPGFRRRGIGEALLRAAFIALHRRGRRGCDLSADSDSPTGADRLYTRLGMRGEPRLAYWQRELHPRRAGG